MELFIGAAFIFIAYKIISSLYNQNKERKIVQHQSYSPSNSSSNLKRKQHSSSKIDVSYRDNEQDDDFATFTIRTSFGSAAETTSNKEKGKWLSEDVSVNIQGREIKKGFFYVGGLLTSIDGYDVEPSLIDEKRYASIQKELEVLSEIYTDNTLGYWPSYASLSKQCRGVYLDWLASDRSLPQMPIGYVFIYFYGLERRIIENRMNNNVSDNEFTSIFNEVSRLLTIYENNRSFRNYATNFMEFMALSKSQLLESKLKDIPQTNNALTFKIKLAKVVLEQSPINSSLALEWLKYTEEYFLKMPARRCEKEFGKLFSLKYVEKFKKGLIVKPNKTKLRLSYQPANSQIHRVDLDLYDLPDPSILKAPINKLVPIAEACTEILSNYSRYLGKAGTSESDIAALMLLPNELINDSTSPVIETFKSWALEIINSNEGITSVEDLWTHTGLSLPKTINKKENELMLNLAAKADIGFAPDLRFHHAKLKIDSKVVLFSPAHGDFFEPSSAFNQIGISLRLGAMVATIDGHVDSSERLALERLIEYDDKLSPTEKRSLKAYVIWRLNTPSSTAGLKARLENIKPRDIDFIKHFIISIAFADGKVDTSEIKQIEKLYTNLGLDKTSVSSDIHTYSSSTTLPKLSEETLASESSSFMLDDAALAMYENHTSDAKSLLEGIFTEDDAIDEPITSVNEEQDGLDDAHLKLYKELSSKDKWTRVEIQKLCSNLNLMIDGAIETINDWAYEVVDAPVLDDDGDIYVDLEIVEELIG